MSERDESVYVRHMLDAIARLERHISGLDKVGFLSSEMVQDAVIRQLEILGEAAGRVSKESCARFTEIPWSRITGLRHRLIHDYLGVDLELVWKVVAVDLAEVTPQIRSMLVSLEQGS
jgi:uncharacterized protein with HEPN domain